MFLLSVHRHQELLVAAGVYEAVADGVHGLDRCHLGNELADDPHAVERGVIKQQIVATCRREYQ